MTFVIESSSLKISIPIFRHLRLIRQPKGPDRVIPFNLGLRHRTIGGGCSAKSSVGVDDMRVIGMQSFGFPAGCALVPFFISVGE